MPASRSDQNVLSTDGVFRGRVRASMIAAAIAINAEARTVPGGFPAWAVADYYAKRATLASKIVLAPDAYAPLVTNGVSTDANVVADATVGGTVSLASLTAIQVATQAGLVTDAHIDAAVAGQFNDFIALG